ncbi:MAG: four helix bundle protein, partial [Myxococcales bacterium]|nr:four helix bundle protein [Myxococcales bacterium]
MVQLPSAHRDAPALSFRPGHERRCHTRCAARGMNHPSSSEHLLSRFVAYRVAVEAAALVHRVATQWRGAGALADQARRAACSVALNLAEGNGHPPGSAVRRRYQRIALGSALELEAALDIATVSALGDAELLANAREVAGRSAALCAG